ncbi:MAG: hypothetical protein AB1586_23030 [Pseudomonadota bacterium]
MREPRHVGADGGPAMLGDLEQSLLTTFCRTLDGSRLPPMTVLRTMAEALGAVYRHAATAHLSQPCPCGWAPTLEADVAALRAAISDAAKPCSAGELVWMEAVGRA